MFCAAGPAERWFWGHRIDLASARILLAQLFQDTSRMTHLKCLCLVLPHTAHVLGSLRLDCRLQYAIQQKY